MKVAIRLDAPVEGDDRVVDRRFEFTAGDQAGVVDGVARGSVHLWCAAQRVSILNPGAVRPLVTGDEPGAAEEPRYVPGREALADLRAQGGEISGEHRV